MSETAGDLRTFRLHPQKHAAFMWRRMAWMIPLVLAVAGGVLAFYQHLEGGKSGTLDLRSNLIIFGVLALMMPFFMVRAARRATDSYRLTLGPDWLRIEARGIAPQTVTRAELRVVREKRGGLELLRARGLPLGVARTLEGYDEVKTALTGWAPSEGRSPYPVPLAVLDTLNVFVWFGLCGYSFVAKTPAVSLLLAVLAGVSALRLSWFFRLMPIKRAALVRYYFWFAAVGVILLNVLRWTWLRR